MQTDRPSYIRTPLIYIMVLLTLSLIGLTAHSDETSAPKTPEASTWKDFNISTVNHYVIPAYKKLNTNAQALNKSIEALCLSPINSTEKRRQSQVQFHNTMDTWQAIQNIQFGPIQTFMRNYSMQFWPDKKNHVGKHLSQLLQSKDHDTLSEDAFHKSSVSIKGLPAIERFLFDEDLNQTLVTRPFNCKVLKRISSYIAETTNSLVIEWHDMAKQFIYTGRLDGYFEDDIEATTTLLKSLIEPIEVIRDLKILRPLGSEFGQQKPKRLESWRSQRSLRNIQMNILSLANLYSGNPLEESKAFSNLEALLDEQEAETIHTQFEKVTKQIAETPSPIEASIETKEGYQALLALSDALKVLHTLLEEAVNNQGIHLGFNSRDGD